MDAPAAPSARRRALSPSGADRPLRHGERAARDGERTRWLAGRGYRVIRFWNNEVFENVEAVLDRIRAAVEPPP